MNTHFSQAFNLVARALEMTPENLANRIQDLLSPRKCRNTKAPLFTSALIRRLNCGRIVSQH